MSLDPSTIHPDRTSSEPDAEAPAGGRERGSASVEARARPEATTGRRVRLRGLKASYGAAPAVRELDLDFEPNRVTAIIGPSGCGKSTLVRCINRMHEEIADARAEGKVLLDDRDIYADDVELMAVRRAVGMVFQKPNPFPTMSIFDNVAAGVRLNGGRKAVAGDVVERSLRGAGLWDEVRERLREPATGLSGGQQQRLCIARTIAVEPEVIIMDEPCSALDPIATLRIEELIGELKERFTIVLVTHNMQQAARVADRTAFMLSGELIEVGETETIFTNPRDKRTEDYVTGKFG